MNNCSCKDNFKGNGFICEGVCKKKLLDKINAEIKF